MRAGIKVNDFHSYGRHGMRLLKRDIGTPPKDDCTERVPFSNMTYDFSSVYGTSYGERTLTYQFDLIERDIKLAEVKTMAIRKWLHWAGRKELIDDMLPDYHFLVREPTLTISGSHGIYTLKAVFKALPEIYPNANKMFTASTSRYPDINGDGIADSVDASLISVAAANIAGGEPSGLTHEQELLADVNRDGLIDTVDASLLLAFEADCVEGLYANTPAGWAAYLNKYLDMGKGVI